MVTEAPTPTEHINKAASAAASGRRDRPSSGVCERQCPAHNAAADVNSSEQTDNSGGAAVNSRQWPTSDGAQIRHSPAVSAAARLTSGRQTAAEARAPSSAGAGTRLMTRARIAP